MLTIRDEQFTALRKDSVADALIDSFQEAGQDAEREPATGDVLVDDNRGNATRYSQDDNGFIRAVTSPLGRTTTLTHDPDGKLLAMRNPAGLEQGYEYDEQGNMTVLRRNGTELCRISYDPEGRVQQVDYPDGTSRMFAYGTNGLIASETDRLGNTEGYEYDDEDNLTAVVDGNGNRTEFEYGEWERPDLARFADGTCEYYDYDDEGRVERIWAGDELVAELEYDDDDEIATMEYGDGQTVHLQHEDSLVTEARSLDTLVTFDYDDEGRVVSEEADGQTTTYAYDEAGLAAITYPTGETVEFTRDDDLRLSCVKDWSGAEHRFRYLPDDGGEVLTGANGVVTTTSRSRAGLPTAFVGRREGQSTPLFSLECEYDFEDRVAKFTDSEFGARSYQYDAETQLLAVEPEGGGTAEQFAYDKAGNRIGAGGQSAVVNPLNQLVLAGGGQCTYDERGNMTSMAGPTGAWRFTFDYRNLLVRADQAGREPVTFGYDAFGRRVWKRCGQKITRYTWAGENLIREVTGEGPGAVAQDYLYYPGTPTPFATRINDKIYCYHTDHLGTPRRVTDEEGNVAWAADYDAFGQARITTEAVHNPWRLPGQYYDEETGLHYNRARYYAPTLGRYLSRDPASFLSGFNFYSYVGNNPTNDADPQGMLWGFLKKAWNAAKTVVKVAKKVAGAAVAVAKAAAKAVDVVKKGAAAVASAAAKAYDATKKFAKKAWEVTKSVGKVVLPIVAAVAVGVAVVLTAPVSLPLAILAAGACAGAVGFGLSEGLNNGFCLKCIGKAMLKGAGVGIIASVPFALFPAAAGVAAVMGLGGASGGLGYLANYAAGYPKSKWSWKGLLWSIGIGAATAGLFRLLGPRIARFFGRRSKTPTPKARTQPQRPVKVRTRPVRKVARPKVARKPVRPKVVKRPAKAPARPKVTKAARTRPRPQQKQPAKQPQKARVQQKTAKPRTQRKPVRKVRAKPKPKPKQPTQQPKPARVKKPGGQADRYKRFKKDSDVPEQYRKDPRYESLRNDPDHQGKITPGGRREAMAGLEAEKQGLMQGPIERGPKGIEFYDGKGTPYDVKTPPSPGTGQQKHWQFKPQEAGDSILHQTRQVYPNKVTGQAEPVKVLLDSTYMNEGDHAALWNYLKQNGTQAELNNIIEVNCAVQ